MPSITFEGHRYPANPGETILDALLRHGALMPSKCKTGSCRTCMVRVVAGTPPPAGQKSLKDTQAARGFILPCACAPLDDITLAHVHVADHEVTLTVAGRHELGPGAVRLVLRSPEPFRYRPGQYVNLVRPFDGRVRSYCLASAPDEHDLLEIHVARTPNGDMSRWLCDDLREGEPVGCYGPAGDCFYLPNDIRRPLLMVGIGTGLAGIHGILQDALNHGHQGPIHLFHAAEPGAHYLGGELLALAGRLPRLTYTPCGAEPADMAQAVKAHRPDLAGWRAYLCGAPAGVKAMQKTAFLAGAAMADIYQVAFGG
ncbi:MAG: 2Fe-2S iron-sulfur cluster binding domain-containing protein [Nitrospirae bacterium]|nr:2Fe-2S iron-sulfur cluster binding domain-containing protein [Nitrospirota bacterium]